MANAIYIILVQGSFFGLTLSSIAVHRLLAVTWVVQIPQVQGMAKLMGGNGLNIVLACFSGG
jgi:hypothetical protein